MTRYQTLYQLAANNCGDAAALEALLPHAKSAAQLHSIGDDRYLSAIARRIFQAGFVWRVINNKWPGFEEAFGGFSPLGVAHFSDEKLEELAGDTRIVRNFGKIVAVRDNALMVLDRQRSHGSFAAYIGDWPEDDVVGLWLDLKKHGKRLGGNSAAMMLRSVGKDTFVLSNDVCAALKHHRLLDNFSTTSQKDLRRIQDVFVDLQQQSGRPMCELSRILSWTV